MSPKETYLACISGQEVTLAAPAAGRGVERRLGEAMGERFSPPGSKINVLTLNRTKLVDLAEYLGRPPTYNIVVNGNSTELDIEQYYLLDCHVIIFNVIDKKVMVHGIEDCQVPRSGNKLNWKKIGEENYGWNLGSGTI